MFSLLALIQHMISLARLGFDWLGRAYLVLKRKKRTALDSLGTQVKARRKYKGAR